MSTNFPLGGILETYKSIIFIHPSLFLTRQAFQVHKDDNQTVFKTSQDPKATTLASARSNSTTTIAQICPSRDSNPHPIYAATIFNFSCNAAKFLFIALSVNWAPVTIGYFFNGPWINASLQG
jgi:hypothetical protein